ncbi:hypothetical protein BKA70DRAFT_1130625, partial [Coprinopsis sp. MPI-PUGE-AT-0042]
RCFPHIVNLACKAVLAEITNTDYANIDEATFLNAVDHDPIATLRALIRAIRSSSLHRQQFSLIAQQLCDLELELVRDVDARWSSTFLMIVRALDLEVAITGMIQECPELEKYSLSNEDWDALVMAEEILRIPHAFQQLLSQEKTTSLGRALPAFESLKQAWINLKTEKTGTATFVNAGLAKLADYRGLADDVPAYLMAMGECLNAPIVSVIRC